MKIWIDADAAPRDVKEIVFRAARRLEIEAVLVANQWISTPINNPWIRAVHAEAGDVAVTADVPLAARLVEKQVIVIDVRGQEYSEENVGERLAVRDFMDGLRGAGIETSGPRPYNPKDKATFAAALDRALTRAARAAKAARKT
jgi:uncharacterized protein YaiI (UPF0178 family)